MLRVPSIRREAQSTSALEGAFAPFEAVLEADVNPQAEATSPELREVRNYVTVAEQALAWVSDGHEITVGLVCDLQRRLVAGTRGDSADAGRIRRGQVVIGPEGCSVEEARFVPPPGGAALETAIQDWQQWLSARHPLPPVVSAALAHYQFEALHPFADGNGRLGRLIIVLQLIRTGAIKDGLLAVSPWFEVRRTEYQDNLLRVSQTGDLDPWIHFFCDGVAARAEATITSVHALLEYHAHLRDLVRQNKWRGAIVHVLDDLIGRPVMTARSIADTYGVTTQAAYNLIQRMLDAGIIVEVTGRSYDRMFAAPRVLESARA
jgi:Fic family protein